MIIWLKDRLFYFRCYLIKLFNYKNTPDKIFAGILLFIYCVIYAFILHFQNKYLPNPILFGTLILLGSTIITVCLINLIDVFFYLPEYDNPICLRIPFMPKYSKDPLEVSTEICIARDHFDNLYFFHYDKNEHKTYKLSDPSLDDEAANKIYNVFIQALRIIAERYPEASVIGLNTRNPKKKKEKVGKILKDTNARTFFDYLYSAYLFHYSCVRDLQLGDRAEYKIKKFPPFLRPFLRTTCLMFGSFLFYIPKSLKHLSPSFLYDKNDNDQIYIKTVGYKPLPLDDVNNHYVYGEISVYSICTEFYCNEVQWERQKEGYLDFSKIIEEHKQKSLYPLFFTFKNLLKGF